MDFDSIFFYEKIGVRRVCTTLNALCRRISKTFLQGLKGSQDFRNLRYFSADRGTESERNLQRFRPGSGVRERGFTPLSRTKKLREYYRVQEQQKSFFFYIIIRTLQILQNNVEETSFLGPCIFPLLGVFLVPSNQRLKAPGVLQSLGTVEKMFLLLYFFRSYNRTGK